MVCEKILLLHFKSGKISVIIFLGPLLMELHFLFMNEDLNIQNEQLSLYIYRYLIYFGHFGSLGLLPNYLG